MEKISTNPIILNGRDVADEVLKKLEGDIKSIKATNKRLPGLAVILIGDNPASKTYVSNKEKMCKKTGINSQVYKLPTETSEKELLLLIDKLNNDNGIDGILLQLPLPIHLKFEKIITHLNPLKDVDGLHPENLGKLLSNQECLKPCTPIGVIKILKHYSIDIAGMNVVIIGRSILVGKPLSMLLLSENATVTVAHSKSENIEKIAKSGDLLIAAAGKAGLIKRGWVKNDAIVIDVGINKIYENGTSKLVGDVLFDEVSSICKAITPVPGGVGPVTIAMLMSNTIQAYNNRNKK
jgi:methylenetetrahydrofolate dehydrogenase (NADP+)/methenyltetrahydrofolate cyclohydrolase